MSQQYTRADRLFILAKVCNANNVTPDDQPYMKLIIGVCTGKLNLSNDVARQYAEDLTSAYRFDKWRSITASTIGPEEVPQIKVVSTQQESYDITPTQFMLKTFTLKTPCTPIKTISPKHNSPTGETTPKNQALILLHLAEHDMFNGVGRVSLAQARYELEDKSLQLQDILNLMRQNLKGMDFETRPGNIILCYLNGKDVTRNNRDMQKIVQPPAKQIYALAPPPREVYEKDAEYGNKNDTVGECTEAADEGEDIAEVE